MKRNTFKKPFKSRAQAALNHQQLNDLRRTEEGREALQRLDFELALRAYSPRLLTLCPESEIVSVELAVAP